ncbi:MAG: hypothetical protein GTN93_26490 [Anaerolineae bacterium]|nr:hypothetical protein [Anaerolineae bacterium]
MVTAKWKPVWRVRHKRGGRVIWEKEITCNILHDEGEQFILQVVFSEEQSPPTDYYIGLDNRASAAEADTLVDLVSEPSGNGYARQAVPSDNTGWTVSQDAGDYQAASTTETFTASGGTIGPVQQMFLCTVATGTAGKLIATAALTASRTLQDQDSLETDITIKLSE